MARKITIFLIFVFLLGGCSSPTAIIQTQEPSSQSPTVTLTSVPSVVTTANAANTTSYPTDTVVPPSPTLINTITPNPTTPSADQGGQSYCDLLTDRYQTPKGFKTYCDTDYDFAFDYPHNWEVTFITGSSDSPGSPAQLVRKAQRFSAPDGSNFVRLDTYRLGSTALSNKIEAFFGYDERKFPKKDYPSLKIGGERAYVSINRWVQDISAVYLFFKHGEYYTIMELKAPSPSALDLNWKIAASLQVPGTSPQDNKIPDELIQDSYSLTGSR